MNLGPTELVILLALLLIVAVPIVIVVVVVKASSRGQNPMPMPMPGPGPGMTNPHATVADQLRDLAALRDQGILSDTEFDQQKSRLLG